MIIGLETFDDCSLQEPSTSTCLKGVEEVLNFPFL